MSYKNLLKKFELNSTITLNNRIVMAPLTRCFADEDLAVTDLITDYYERRADIGLIITEATIINAGAQGYPNTPGIYSKKQITQWKKVTDKVHAKGGKIFVQLWHVGRVSHPSFRNGEPTIAPSAVALEGRVPRTDLEYGTPRALETKEVYEIIEDYKQAALNAIEAGFDGVEIHGANGYLIDQFFHQHTNKREDEFGGSLKARAKFAMEIVNEIINAIGKDRVGIRLSPGAYFHQENTIGDEDTYEYFLKYLSEKNIAYVHTGVFDDSMEFDYLGGSATSFLKKHFNGVVIASGSYSPEKANESIGEDKFDLIAIGRDIISNPDYVEKLTNQRELTEYTEAMLTELY